MKASKYLIVIVLLGILFLVSFEPLAAQYPVNKEGKSPFVNVVKNIRESVVNIQVEAETEVRGQRGRSPFDDDFFRFFFGPMPETRKSASMGSGFIFRRDGNTVYIMTNNHVIDQGENKTITVTLADKGKHKGEVVGLDPMTDIAIIKIEVPKSEKIVVAPLGSSDDLEIGDWAIAIGNPFGQLGLDRTVTVGVISATGRSSLNFGQASPLYQDYIQTDAAINPGNSGGPLLDINGKVIGINSAITSTSGGNIGIGFAIPIDLAKKVVDDFLEHGRVVRGYLGILPQEITADLQQSLELKQIGGVLVAKVEKDTPAEKGGLKNGDVILKFNYESVKNVSHFRILVANALVGKRIPVEVVRNNQRKSLYVVLTEQPSTEGNNSQPAKQNSHWLGLDVQGLTDDFATKNQIVADFGVVI
ncbi:MAG: trypsin-like peptidase domain-containing protein, partial [Candidatus Cloacimonas sp.]|nr:trypsin-like peptidase domain-containing protein [Candidatus Cloacimonadota bacterium]